MQLAINIDHVATIRNARGGREPDPIEAARICEEAGAVGIVCHLREDRRHIRDGDVRQLRKSLKTKLDLEMAATDEIIQIALSIPSFESTDGIRMARWLKIVTILWTLCATSLCLGATA